MERRKARLVSVSLPASRARRWNSGSASPCGAPLRRFWARGPYFRMGRANPDPADFAAFISIPCSRERQSHVVGPDGVTPASRTTCVRDTRAGAASCSASKAPSRSAPHDQDMPNIGEVQNAGTRIPITKCFRRGLTQRNLRCSRSPLSAVMPGRGISRAPEIHGRQPDSGSHGC